MYRYLFPLIFLVVACTDAPAPTLMPTQTPIPPAPTLMPTQTPIPPAPTLMPTQTPIPTVRSLSDIPDSVEPTDTSLHNHLIALQHKMADSQLDHTCSEKLYSKNLGQLGCYGEGMVPRIGDGVKEYLSTFTITIVHIRDKHDVRRSEYSIEWVAESIYSEYGTLYECLITFDPELSFDCEDSRIVDNIHAAAAIASSMITTGFDHLLEELAYTE